MRRLSLPIAIAVAACGHAPPRPPPAVEKPVAAIADVAGAWVTDDDMGWFYSLSITAKGAMTQTIDRGKLSTCEQRGAFAAGDVAKTYELTYAKNTCSQEYGEGAVVQVEVASFTGKEVVLVFKNDSGGQERRAYHRDPKVAQ